MEQRKFRVLVVGSAMRLFDNAAEALTFARRNVYLSDTAAADMVKRLEQGHAATWCYGFEVASVTPE